MILAFTETVDFRHTPRLQLGQNITEVLPIVDVANQQPVELSPSRRLFDEHELVDADYECN